MKRFSTGTISALLLTGAIAPVAMAGIHQDTLQAQSNYQGASPMGATPSMEEVSPFELSYFTYYGGMEDYGIDGGIVLVQDFRNGDVTAEDIVQTAVNNDFVESEALTDTRYIESVKDFLWMFENTDTSNP